MRYVAAEQLGNLSRREAVVPLITALDDREELVRLNAAERLGKIRSRTAVPRLIRMLSAEKKALVRAYAAEALVRPLVQPKPTSPRRP